MDGDHDLTIADELVIGIGTAELSESRSSERHRYVGITTVFRGDGNYLLGQLSRVHHRYNNRPTVDVADEYDMQDSYGRSCVFISPMCAARSGTRVTVACNHGLTCS